MEVGAELGQTLLPKQSSPSLLNYFYFCPQTPSPAFPWIMTRIWSPPTFPPLLCASVLTRCSDVSLSSLIHFLGCLCCFPVGIWQCSALAPSSTLLNLLFLLSSHFKAFLPSLFLSNALSHSPCWFFPCICLSVSYFLLQYPHFPPNPAAIYLNSSSFYCLNFFGVGSWFPEPLDARERGNRDVLGYL